MGDHWSLWSARGVRFDFNVLTGTSRWNLSAITDRHGNRVEYEWAPTPGAPCAPGTTATCLGGHQLEKIHYFTNTAAGITARTTLWFRWGPRHDVLSSARQGQLVYLEKRLLRIEVHTEHGNHHRYDVVFHHVPDKDDPNTVMLGAIEARSPDGSVQRMVRRFGYASSFVGLSTATSLSQLEGQSEALPTQYDGTHWDRGVRAIDINGDGFADLMNNLERVLLASRSHPGVFEDAPTSGYNTFLAGPELDPDHKCLMRWSLPTGPLSHSCGWSVMDIDGDTRPDLLHLPTVNASGAAQTAKFYTNTGLSWAASTPAIAGDLAFNHTARQRHSSNGTVGAWQDMSDALVTLTLMDHNEGIHGGGHSSVSDAGVRFGDVNGDGLMDLVRMYHDAWAPAEGSSAAREVIAVWLQRANAQGEVIGWSLTTDPERTGALEALASGSSPVFFAYNDGRTGFDLTDVNGDGLADLVRLVGDDHRVYLNTGFGWTLGQQYTATATAEDIHTAGYGLHGGSPIPGWSATSYNYQLDSGILPIDYNNDGLLDYVQSRWHLAGPMSGTEDRIRAWLNTGDRWVRDERMETVLRARQMVFADAYIQFARNWLLGDFDGDARLDFLHLGATYAQKTIHWTLGSMPRLLNREVNEFGGIQQLEFTTPALGLAEGNWELQDSTGRFSVPVLSVVREQNRVDCAPAPGLEPACNGAIVDRERTQFSYHLAAVDHRGFMGFGRMEAQNLHGPPAVDGTRLRRTYTPTNEACGDEFEVLERLRPDGSLAQRDVQYLSETTLPDGRLRCHLSQLQSQIYDPGVPMVERNLHFLADAYGNTTEVNDTGFAHVTTDGAIRRTFWTTSSDGRAVDLRYKEEERAIDETLLAMRQYRYDGLAVGAAGAGVLTHREHLTKPGVWAVETLVTDVAGRVTQRTDPDGVAEERVYLADTAWPTQRKLGVGGAQEIESMVPDALHGRPLSVTDRNGDTVTFDRDIFGLLTRITRSADAAGSVGSLDFSIPARGDPTQQYLLTQRPLDARVLHFREHLDGFGRVTRVEDLGAAAESERRIQDIEYDGRGNLHRVSLPRGAADSPRWVTYAHDALNRVTSIERPGGFTLSRAYRGDQRKVIDPRGHSHDETINWRDQVVQSTEEVGGVPRTTTWAYDAFGRLTSLTDAGGTMSQFGYDMAGIATLHSDPSTGTTTFENSLAGRRRFTWRADGSHVESVYDTLGRQVVLRTSDGKETRFIHGTSAAAHDIGRVARVEAYESTTAFTYTSDGEVASRTLTLDGHTYTVTFGHARNGELTAATMPGGRVLSWTLDDFGRPYKAWDGTRLLASGVTYDAEDHLRAITYGNGLLGEFGYDPVTARPSTARLQGGALMDATFGFDANGNVTSVSDPARPTTASQNFVYNAANELIREDTTAGSEHYDYDAAGSLLRLGGRGFDLDPTHPHRVACVRPHGTTGACGVEPGSHAVTYDARGNVSARNGAGFAHDLHNRVHEITSGTTVVQRTSYDGLGGVAATERNGVHVALVGEWFEQHPGFHVVHVPLGGRRVASVRVSGFVGTPVMMAMRDAPTWDAQRASGAARTRGLAWGAALAGLLALVAMARRRVALLDGLRGAWTALRGRRGPWLSLRPARALALVAVAVLTVVPHEALIAVAHAEEPPLDTTYYHGDIVGSAELLTDDAGAVVRRTDHRPYGEVRAETGGVSYLHSGFQGATRSEVGHISHMGARHYDAELGRFLEADDRQPDVSNPHQLNRYAFAGGNPVSVTDPSGHGWVDALHVAFVIAIAVLTSVLTLGAALPMWVAGVTGLVMALFAAQVFSATTQALAEAGTIERKDVITAERALIVGLIVGGLIAGGYLAGTGVLALAPTFTVAKVGWGMVIGWAIEVGFDLIQGAYRQETVSSDKDFKKWAMKFVAKALIFAGFGSVFASAGAAVRFGSFWMNAASVVKYGAKVVLGLLATPRAVFYPRGRRLGP